MRSVDGQATMGLEGEGGRGATFLSRPLLSRRVSAGTDPNFSSTGRSAACACQSVRCVHYNQLYCKLSCYVLGSLATKTKQSGEKVTEE